MSNIGQQFLEKLIQDTQSGVWDNGWGVNSAGNMYTFTAPKQILTKANFTLDADNKGKELSSGCFVFPNGYGIIFDNLAQLRDVVLESLERSVVSDMKKYDRPIIVVEDKNIDLEDKSKITQPIQKR